MKQTLCITVVLLGVVAVCQLEAGRGSTVGQPIRGGKIGRGGGDFDDRMKNLQAMGQVLKQIRKEQEEYKHQQAALTGEKIDADGKFPWAFRKLFELCEVSEAKIKLAEKRYLSYLKTRATYREKRDTRREELIKIRDKKVNEKDWIIASEACDAINKLDADFWTAYNRNYANMLQGVDNYLSSKQRLAWPATSLLAETLSHFNTDKEKELFTDEVFKTKIEAISKEAKLIGKLKTYKERVRRRKTLYDSICKEFKLRKFYKADKTARKDDKKGKKEERKEERKEDKEERTEDKKTKEDPKTKPDDGFGGW